MTKVLTMCQGGHVRSVGLKRVLTYLKIDGSLSCDTLACGCETSSTETREMLCAWADLIIVMQPFIEAGVPEHHRHKMICYDVGPDIWSNAEHPDLEEKLTKMVMADRIRWFN